MRNDDLLASMLLSVVYTTMNTDIIKTNVEEQGGISNNQIGKYSKKDDLLDVLKQEQERLEKIKKPNKKQEQRLLNLTKTINYLEAMLKEENLTQSPTPAQVTMVSDQNLSSVRLEVENDTVAVCRIKDTLVIAFNIPQRQKNQVLQPLTASNKQLTEVTPLIEDNILNVLNEFDDVIEYLYQLKINKVVVLRPQGQGKLTERDVHAEMQLVSYAMRHKITPDYIGVSQKCCPNCATVLQDRKIGYNDSHKRKVTNWRAPKMISTKEQTVYIREH